MFEHGAFCFEDAPGRAGGGPDSLTHHPGKKKALERGPKALVGWITRPAIRSFYR